MRNPIAAFMATGPVQPAHKAGRSTSYKAQGMVQPDTGLEAGSSQPTIIRELVPELSSPITRRAAFAQMQNDAGVDVSLRAVKTPVLGSEFYMEPASDDPNDKLVSDFTWENLAGGMNAPLINAIEDILRMYEDGLSVLEKVYEERPWAPTSTGANSKTYTMLKKLGVRPESTISKIEYDNNGGPAKITQQAIQADNSIKEVEIPINKLVIFTFNRRGGDIRGKSILRTAYPHWYYKTHLYKIDAIQKERHSLGIPKGKLLPGYTEKDKGILRTLLRNLRTNEESFLMLPPAVDVEFAEVKGNLVNVLESAEHHNAMIMMNVMAQFLTATSSSNRSTAATQVDMFLKALKYVANYIAEVINMYVIPELVVYNFNTTNFPKLKVKNIGETKDLQMLAAAFANLMSQGGITPDLPTENWFRKVFDMPAKQPNAEQTVQPTSADPNQNGNSNGASQNGKGGVQDKVKPGNIGKSPNNGAMAMAEGLMIALHQPPVQQPENSIEFHHETPVHVDATSQHQHEHDVDLELKLEEGAISNTHEHHVDVAAPNVIIHTSTPSGEVIVKHVKPKAANVVRNDDGSTRIEYEYDEDATT